MGSLQKLSLYSSFYWGFWPKLSLDGVHFPNLQSLALGNFSFFKDEQLDWILSHSTLEELYLDDCPILLEARILDNENDLSESPIPKSELEFRKNEDRSDSWHYNYPSRWSNYFASIEAGLPHLRHFAFGHNAAWDYPGGVPFEKEKDLETALRDDRYMAFDGGIGPSQFIWKSTLPHCYEEDCEALNALFKKINHKVDREN